MTLISRYIFRQSAGALVMILVTLTLIVWMTTALKQLDLLTGKGQSMLIFLQVTLLALPNLIALIAPIALLIACVHSLNRLNGDSEIIILTASGGTIWRIARPFLLLGLIISVFVAFSNAYLSPKSLRLLREYIVQVRTDLISQVIQPGKFSAPEEGMTFHIRDRAANGDLLGLMVHDARNKPNTMTYLAERAQIIKDGERALLVMHGGQIQKVGPKKTDVNIVAFDSYLFDISALTAQPDAKISYKPKERYLSELLNPGPKDWEYQHYPGKFRAELHQRLASPLYPILFALIAVVSLGYARTTREGRGSSLFLAFLSAVLLRAAGIAATNLAAKHFWAVGLIYGIPLIGIAAAIYMGHRNMRPHAPQNFSWPSLFVLARRG